MKAPYKKTWTGVRWLLLARGACGSGRLWGACAQSDGGLALSRRGHVHPRSGFGHGRLCSNAYPPSGSPLGVFLLSSSLVFMFIPLVAACFSYIFIPRVFSRIVFLCHRLRLCDAFSGAAAAAAGRGSPPPPRPAWGLGLVGVLLEGHRLEE